MLKLTVDQLPQPATLTEMYLASIAQSLEKHVSRVDQIVNALDQQTKVLTQMLKQQEELNTYWAKITVASKSTK